MADDDWMTQIQKQIEEIRKTVVGIGKDLHGSGRTVNNDEHQIYSTRAVASSKNNSDKDPSHLN